MFPVAIELDDAGVGGIVIGAANAEIEIALRIGVDAEDASGGLGAGGSGPLPLEFTGPVEELQARVFAVGDEDIRAAGTNTRPWGFRNSPSPVPFLPHS